MQQVSNTQGQTSLLEMVVCAGLIQGQMRLGVGHESSSPGCAASERHILIQHMPKHGTLSLCVECADYGYEVDYTRVPVTDEKAPKEKDFALLMRRLWRPPEGAALIFNCQMGRGRTSTGMIIASLLHLRRRLQAAELPPEPQGDSARLFNVSKATWASTVTPQTSAATVISLVNYLRACFWPVLAMPDRLCCMTPFISSGALLMSFSCEAGRLSC